MADVTVTPSGVSSAAWDSGHTEVAWTNLVASNLTADDGSFVTCAVASSQYTQLLKIEFDTPSIAAGSRIDGIEVSFLAQCTGSASAFTLRELLLLYNSEPCGISHFDPNGGLGLDVGLSPGNTHTFGGATDKWGIDWTVASTANIGLGLKFERNGGSSQTVSVDHVTLKVYYTTAAGDVSYETFDVGIAQVTPPGASVTKAARAVFPGLGTPDAVLIFSSSLDIGDADPPSTPLLSNGSPGACIGWGMADDTRIEGAGIALEDGVTNWFQKVAKLVANADMAAPINSGANTVHNRASDGGTMFGTDYVECTFLNGSHGDWNTYTDVRQRIFTVIAFKGVTNAYAFGQDGLNGAIAATSTPNIGFEADLLIVQTFAELRDGVAGHFGYGAFGLGFVDNDGTPTQRHALWEGIGYDENIPGNVTDAMNFARVSTDRAHDNYDTGETPWARYHWDIGSFTSTGYTITSAGANGTADDGAAILALELPAGVLREVGTLTTPTSTGSQDISIGTGIAGRFVMGMLTKAEAVDTDYNDVANAESFTFFAANKWRAFSIGIVNDNGATPSDVGFRHSGKLFDLPTANNADFVVSADGPPTFGNEKITLTVSAADSTARRGVYLIMGEAAASVSAAVTGTLDESTETDIRNGGRTTIITLTGDTWVAAGAAFDAQRQPIINGCTAAEAEAAGWNAQVRDNEDVASVVRTSDTVVTITWTAAPGHQITATENITVTVPAAALVTSASAVVAAPAVQVQPNAFSVSVGGTVRGTYEPEVVAQAHTLVLTLTEGETWIAAGTGPIGTTAQSQALIDGITSAQVEAGGWNAQIRDVLVPATHLVRTSDTTATLTIPATAGYSITANETITPTIPAAVLTVSASPIVGAAFTINEGERPSSSGGIIIRRRRRR